MTAILESDRAVLCYRSKHRPESKRNSMVQKVNNSSKGCEQPNSYQQRDGYPVQWKPFQWTVWMILAGLIGSKLMNTFKWFFGILKMMWVNPRSRKWTRFISIILRLVESPFSGNSVVWSDKFTPCSLWRIKLLHLIFPSYNSSILVVPISNTFTPGGSDTAKDPVFHIEIGRYSQQLIPIGIIHQRDHEVSVDVFLFV